MEDYARSMLCVGCEFLVILFVRAGFGTDGLLLGHAHAQCSVVIEETSDLDSLILSIGEGVNGSPSGQIIALLD